MSLHCQNATLLEISCHGSYVFEVNKTRFNVRGSVPLPRAQPPLIVRGRCIVISGVEFRGESGLNAPESHT